MVALVVRDLPAKAGDIKMLVRFLGWEDPLEKGMATLSSILAWRIPWTEEPDRLQSTGSQRVGHEGVANTFICKYCIYFYFLILEAIIQS